MIEVAGLTKRYGSFTALKGVSYQIAPGDVVGLLGPNGAGKTTMLKILTGYLPPSEGTANVAGFDVSEQSLEVRRRIGYLPEANPLYDDLPVIESLRWTARLRGLSGDPLSPAIRRAVEVCGLGSVVGKDISQLSKGYRQRVGLAQAILHDPDILILDEPTSGLDPNQQAEVLALIQTLKQKKTVIVSTHILSEAQQACDRVLIIHQGAIVADGKPDELGRQLAGAQRVALEWKAPSEESKAVLGSLAGVSAVHAAGGSGEVSRFEVDAVPGADVREAVFHVAAERRWPILELKTVSASLADVFRQLTHEVSRS
jgi:ABC-2 type transport system ATP-binding protein